MCEGRGVDEVGGFVYEAAEGGGGCVGVGHPGGVEDVGFVLGGRKEVGEPFFGSEL